MAVSLAPNVGNWWECSGDELWAMNLRRSNFVAQCDKSARRGGNQALTTMSPGVPGTHLVDCRRMKG